MQQRSDTNLQPGPFRVSSVFAGALLFMVCGLGGLSGAPAVHAQGLHANGDIPDTAVYVTYRGAGFIVKYVEGWGILKLPHGAVRISDKDSSEVVAVNKVKTSVAATAGRDLTNFTHSLPQFRLVFRHTVQLQPGTSVYLQYRTLSGQDPVTGKRVPILVDRYYIPGKGRQATLTLSTPVGVDNVDAFKLIARSFRWK